MQLTKARAAGSAHAFFTHASTRAHGAARPFGLAQGVESRCFTHRGPGDRLRFLADAKATVRPEIKAYGPPFSGVKRGENFLLCEALK